MPRGWRCGRVGERLLRSSARGLLQEGGEGFEGFGEVAAFEADGADAAGGGGGDWDEAAAVAELAGHFGDEANAEAGADEFEDG